MSRVRKTVKNGVVAVVMNILLLLLAFVSRDVFIGYLGDNITGLNSTLTDLLGFLNLAEMGVLSAVAFALYKPLFDGDRKEANNIMSLLAYMYRRIGIVIAVGGVVLSLFLPLLFDGKGVDITLMYTGYYTLLVVNLLSYFANYKQNILIADQCNWVIVYVTGLVYIIKTTLQILVLKYSSLDPHICYLLYLLLELIFGVVYSCLINRRVSKLYPWLKPSWVEGREIKGRYSDVFKRVKQLFSHKIGSFVLTQTDSLVIAFFSAAFSAVTVYTNYTLIFSRLTRLFFAAFDNITAGIGNLVAEGEQSRVKSSYKELSALFFLIAGVIVICGYHLTNPFIRIWLGDGERFILQHAVFVVILINIYISIIRRISEIFLSASGLYSDVWVPWVEAFVNLAISIVGGYYYGVLGVVVGTMVSTLFAGVLWKPYFLHRYSFNISSWGYFARALKYLLLTAIVAISTYLIIEKLGVESPSSYLSWFVYATLLTLSTAIFMLLLFAATDGPSRFIIARLWGLMRKRFIKG